MSARKIIGWVFVGIGVLLLIVVVGGYFTLKSGAFHRYVIAKIEQTANESTGATLSLQKLDISVPKLSATAYGIVVHGSEGSNTAPLLSVDQLSLTLKIVSLLHRRIDLSQILIQHPVVHLIAYDNGQTNLPHPSAPKKQSKPVNVFDLGIQHFLLANGEIYYNQEKTPINADLHDLRTEVGYSGIQSRYKGSMSYRDGRLQVGKARPLAHDLNANFTATPSQFELKPAVLQVANSTVRIQATVNDYSNPAMDGSYQILLHTPDFESLMAGSPVPVGDVSLSGSLTYRSQPNRPFLRDVVLHGDLDSKELSVVTPQVRTAIRALHARYDLADGNLNAKDIAADLLGGHLSAALTMLHMDTTPVSHLSARLQSLSLTSARSSLRSAQDQQIPVSGRVDGAAIADWTGSLKTLRAKADLGIKGAIHQDSSGNPNLMPIDGSLHVKYDGPKDEIAFRDSFLRTPQTLIDIRGTVSNHSDLRVQARTGDLQELSQLASALKAPSGATSPATGPSTMNISGSGTLNAQVTGTMKNPRIAGQVNANDLAVEGGRFRTLQFAIQASPSGVAIQRGSLVADPKGEAVFSANVSLKNWKYADSNPIAANISVRQMPLRQLQQFAHANYPVTGNLSADVQLQGSQLNPVGQGSAQITQAKVYGQTVQNLALKFNAAGSAVHSTLALNTPAGGANANLVLYPKNKGYELQLHVPGLNLAQLDTVQEKNIPVSGTLTASASGKGTFDNPQLVATIQIPQLQLRQANVQGIKAQMNVANHRADLALDSQLLESGIRARGTMNLEGDYYTTATLDTKGLPLGPLIALYKPVPQQVQGELEFHASVKGPAKNKSKMEAHLTVPTLRVAYNQVQIGNVGVIKADYVNGVLTLPAGEIRGTDSDLKFHGEIPLQGSAPPRLQVTGAVDMQLAQLFDPTIQSGGKVNLNVQATKSASSKVGVQGQVRLENVSLATATAPLGVQNVNGVFDIDDNQVRITELKGKSGGGDISAAGTVAYKPAVKFNVSLNTKAVRLRYPEGMRAVLDSNLTLLGSTDASTLNGRVLIDSLGFTPDFDLMEFMGQLGGGPNVPPTGQGFTQNLKLNVALQSTSQLRLVSSQLSLQGGMNLRVVGTAANPVIVGRTDFTGGDLFFQNNRYTLQRGIIDFVNPNETQPVLNVVITTVVQQYNLTLTMLGPIDRLRTSYSSDPPLATVDVINLIARGQTTEESTPGSLSANSVLASGLASQVSSRLQKFAGISSLQIDPTIGGNGTDPSARIAIQQRVTRNFIFTFSTDVTNPQGEVVQGDYQVSKHWAVSATRDQWGGYAFDGKYRTTF